MEGGRDKAKKILPRLPREPKEPREPQEPKAAGKRKKQPVAEKSYCKVVLSEEKNLSLIHITSRSFAALRMTAQTVSNKPH